MKQSVSKRTLAILLTLVMLVQAIAVCGITVGAAEADTTPGVVYEESFNSGLWTVEPKTVSTGYAELESFNPTAGTVSGDKLLLSKGDSVALWWQRIPGVKETGTYTLTFDVDITDNGKNTTMVSGKTWKRELNVLFGGYWAGINFRSDTKAVSPAGKGLTDSSFASSTYSVKIVFDNTAATNKITTTVSKADGTISTTTKSTTVDSSSAYYEECSQFWAFRCEDGAVEVSNFTFTDGTVSLSGFEAIGESFLSTEGEGLWRVEPSEPSGYDSYNPTAPFGYNGTLYLDEGNAVALYWKNIPGAKDKGIYTISFDVDITDKGNNNSLISDAIWKRELNVAFGAHWAAASFRSDTKKILASGTGYTDENYGQSTYSVTIEWNNMIPINSIRTTVKSDTFSTSKLSTVDSATEWYEEDGQFWSFRCEDGAVQIRNFKVSVVNEPDPVSTTEASIPNAQQLIYEFDLAYQGEAVAVKANEYELISLSESGMTVFSSIVVGNFTTGAYHVKAYVNPTQRSAISEITLPGGGVIRRGTKMSDANREFSLGIYGNSAAVSSEVVSYAEISPDEYTIIPEEPAYEGFGASVYNPVSSFTDARYDRAFAWTALESFVGDSDMAVKYRAEGDDAWTVVDAVREVEALSDTEDYFEADVTGLKASTRYEYKIGVKDSTDEENDWSKSYFFTTSEEVVGDFSFIAIGDNQGHSWDGVTPSDKGYMYTQTAITQALSTLKNPAFIVNTGDLTENNTPEEWSWYFDAMGESVTSIPHFATIGGGVHDNHDYFDMHFNHPNNGGSAAYTNPDAMLEATPTGAELVNYLDETVYSFNYGDLHFVVIDSGAAGSVNTKAIMTQQREWLAADLEANKDAKWKIVMTHQPAYKTGSSNFNANYLADIVESYGVDLVLQGHMHHVTRSYPMKNGAIATKAVGNEIAKGVGTIYTTIGPTTVNHGAYDSSYMEPMQAVINNDNHLPCYTVVDVKGDVLTMTVRQADGLVLDTFTITGEAQAPEEESGVEIPGYGILPAEYSDAAQYPIVAFANGEFAGAAKKWSEIETLARTVLVDGVKKVTVLLRGNVATDKPIYLYAINGTLEIDLCDFTVTGTSGILFNGKVASSYTGDYESSVIVKNGTLVVDSKYIYYSENAQTDGADKVMNLTLENVTVGKTAASTQNQTFFAGYDSDAAARNNTLNLTLNGCTVDFTECTKSSTNLFHFTRTKKGGVNVVINGGSIVYPKNYKTTLNIDGIGSGSTFTLGEYDGAYPKLLLADGASAPTKQFATAENGKLSFAKTGAKTIDGVAYGEYGLVVEIEDYGFLPVEYSDASAYPIVAFVNGEFAGTTSSWKAIATLVSGALSEHNGATVTVLLRNDITNDDSIYFYGMDGTVIFDLGGHTVTVNKILLRGTVTADYRGDYETSVVMKNGTLLMNANYIFLSQNKQIDGTDKVFNFTFEGVTVKKGAYTGNQSFYASSNDNPTKNNTFNFVFNDCTFDYSESAKSCYLFNFDRDKVFATVTVNGGSILGPTSDYKLNLIRLNSGSTVAFGKGSDGYTTLTLPEGANTPTDSLSSNAFKNVDGDGVAFVKIGDAYRLALTELKLTGAYLNLASDINVIYSANVPAGYENPYMVFEFGGKSYTVREHTVAADGELLFAFEGVTPQMLGENIKATLYATKDGVEASVEKAEYSVLAYCKSMLNKTDDAKLKTLLSDLLVYGATSQTYLGYKTDALVTDGLDLTPSIFAPLASTDKALLGEKNEAVTWNGVALRYENAMAMKLNFKADASLTLKVTINGRTTTYALSELAADGNGNYTVYFRGILATEYGDTVTAALYDGDVQVGQSVNYSVNSYVYSMQESENAALAALVQATYNYGASAESYAGK